MIVLKAVHELLGQKNLEQIQIYRFFIDGFA